jgi:hypothetical protein
VLHARSARCRSGLRHTPQNSLSSVMGRSVMRLPVALNTALATAPGKPTISDLTESVDANEIGDGVLGRQEGRVERRHIGVDWDEVVRHGHNGPGNGPGMSRNVGVGLRCGSDRPRTVFQGAKMASDLRRADRI